MTTATQIVTDSNGRILEATSSAAQLLGIADRRLVGKPLAAFVLEASRREFRTLLLDLGRGGGPIDASLALRRRDGAELNVAVEAIAAPEPGRLEWTFGASDREQPSPDAVSSSLPETAPLGRLLSRLPVGIVTVTPSLEVEYVNPAARVYLGEGGPGRLLPDPWPGFSLRKFARRLFSGTPPPRRLLETATGRLLELEGITGADSRSAILVIHDVTSRERRRRAEAEFVTNAAHELRTPIAAIGSAVEVLQGGAKETPADRDRFLGHIERESERLGRLAGALMLLARIQTGQDAPSLGLVGLRPLLEDVGAEVTPKEGVVVSVSCTDGLSALADEDLLRQAVWNLAANAARHTVSGRIVFSGRDLGPVAEIEVLDTGPGISEEDQKHIFDRFFRAERRGRDGFGLGLPITREIVHALGGSVSLESTPGSGTRVRLHLPSARVVRE